MNGSSFEPRPARVAWLRFALALTLFAAVWGAKLAIIGRYGSDLPFWDQWQREGDHLLIPWFERHEWWRPLTAPHNEHHIVPTLVANFSLVQASGQWDGRVQCAFSAALHALIVTALFVWALRRLPFGWALATGVLLGATASLPIDWENLLSGFQSQFYFLIGFTLLACRGLLWHRPFSAAWWGGASAGALALVSMGSGLLLGGVVVSMILMRRILHGRKEPGDAATLVAGVGLGVAGACLFTPIPGHAGLHAQTVSEFFVYLLRCLAWPLPAMPWLAPLVWAPWVVLLVRHLRQPPASPGEARRAEFVIAIGLWVLLQAAAVAYSRSGSKELPASRYGDVFEVGLMLCFAAFAVLPSRRNRHVLPIAAIAWLGMVLAAHALAARTAWDPYLANKKADHARYEANVHRFVLNDDYPAFAQGAVPFPNPDWIARILRTPCIRAVLPVSVRAPLAVPALASLESYGGGLPVAPLPERASRALAGRGEWRSAELPVMRGWWKIETAGHLGTPGAALELVAVRDGRVLASVAPSKPAGATWRAAYISAPEEPARLVARCESADHWFAFSEPTVMSPTSWGAWQLCRQGPAIAAGGGMVFILLAIVSWWRNRRRRMTYPMSYDDGSRPPQGHLPPDRQRIGLRPWGS